MSHFNIRYLVNYNSFPPTNENEGRVFDLPLIVFRMMELQPKAALQRPRSAGFLQHQSVYRPKTEGC